MSHTKGEWIFEKSDFTIRTGDFQLNAGMGDYRRVIIAHLDPENWRNVRPDSIAEKTANAQLIAAAPDLLEALEEIKDLETECCSRCEGNGRLYADGKAHLISENADTTSCGNCGGSGRILPNNAQDIAEVAIAKAKKG